MPSTCPESKLTSNRSTNSIIEFQKITKSTIVIQYVHHLIGIFSTHQNNKNSKRVTHLVNARSLRHHEPTLTLPLLLASLENINGLNRHFLQPRLISRIGAISSRAILHPLQVIPHYIPIDPLGHVRDREYAQRLVRRSGGLELGVVVDDVIALRLECLVEVCTIGGAFSGNELLGASSFPS